MSATNHGTATKSLRDGIEEHIGYARDRGQRVSEWQRASIYAWAARKLTPERSPKGTTYIDLGVYPSLCDCSKCATPALIFPPEKGAPGGYCVCPKCSAPLDATPLS